MAGQIIERSKGTYLVRVFLGRDAKGKRKYHNKTIHGTKKDAQKYLNAVLREKDLGQFFEPSKVTVEDYMRKWLDEIAQHKVSERVHRDYVSNMERHVFPVIGDVPLAQLQPIAVQSVINSMQKKGITRTTRYTHMILKQALNQAVKWDMLSRNPAEHIDLPKEERSEMLVLSKQQAKDFLEVAQDDRFYALFVLLLTTGLRPAEAYALKWSDTDLNKGQIYVQRSLGRNQDGWYLKATKTARSRRNVPLPKDAISILKNHKLEQTKERIAAKTWNDDDFVFTLENGSPIQHHNFVKRHFKPVIEQAGIDAAFRLYDLRHTCATLLLAAGEHPKIVSERLGHSSVTMTLDRYSHVLPDMQQQAASKLQDMLFN